MSTFNKVYEIVVRIPKGKVTTYGFIASLLNTNPKVIGFALHANKNHDVTCHRVINSKGKISSGYAFGGPNVQKNILISEGIKFDENEVVDLKTYGYYLT